MVYLAFAILLITIFNSTYQFGYQKFKSYLYDKNSILFMLYKNRVLETQFQFYIISLKLWILYIISLKQQKFRSIIKLDIFKGKKSIVFMLYINHVLETLLKFNLLIWISNIQNFKVWISLR